MILNVMNNEALSSHVQLYGFRVNWRGLTNQLVQDVQRAADDPNSRVATRGRRLYEEVRRYTVYRCVQYMASEFAEGCVTQLPVCMGIPTACGVMY